MAKGNPVHSYFRKKSKNKWLKPKAKIKDEELKTKNPKFKAKIKESINLSYFVMKFICDPNNQRNINFVR